MSNHWWNLNTPIATSSTAPRKRAFPGGSSSSSGGKEVEELDLELHLHPPSIGFQKSSPEEKEVKSRKITINLDDDDDDDEVVLIDGSTGKSTKGKETFAVGHTSTTNGAHGSPEFKSSENQDTPSPMASAFKDDPKIMNERLQRYVAFKKFDTVEDSSDHKYSTKCFRRHPPKEWAKRIQKEWTILEKGLPDTIFVRAYESRMDLLRVVIVGAKGTPYHDGLYFFDVYFPVDYPEEPPQVHYWSGGLRINPNLYDSGKVCLSLLGTWYGEQVDEEWIPENSTVLQVLVSIQGLILNTKPYLNEPGFEDHFGPEHPNVYDYNEEVFTLSLKTMLYNIRRPSKHFEDFVVGHFSKYGRDILVCCKAYMDGAQVGCVVKGGVQDVDEGDKSCSRKFKDHLVTLITEIVNAFSEIGAKDCDEFLSLAQTRKTSDPPEPFFSFFG